MIRFDGLPVVVDPHLKHGEFAEVGGTVHIHCPDCLQAGLDDFNKSFAIVHTVPICLLDKRTGQLVDLPPVPPRRNRWRPGSFDWLIPMSSMP